MFLNFFLPISISAWCIGGMIIYFFLLSELDYQRIEDISVLKMFYASVLCGPVAFVSWGFWASFNSEPNIVNFFLKYVKKS